MRRHYLPPPPSTRLVVTLSWRERWLPSSYRTWPWWASESWDRHVAGIRMLPVLRQHGLTVTWRDYARAYTAAARDIAWAAALCVLLVLGGCALVWSGL